MDSRTISLEGIRLYLRRVKTLTELQALAGTLISTDPAEYETTLTNIGFGSSNASSIVRQIDRFQVLKIVEDLTAEMVSAGVTSWTSTQSANACNLVTLRADFSRAPAQN